MVAEKGHETYQINGDIKEFFDDREECRKALQFVDKLHQTGIDMSEFPWRSVTFLMQFSLFFQEISLSPFTSVAFW